MFSSRTHSTPVVLAGGPSDSLSCFAATPSSLLVKRYQTEAEVAGPIGCATHRNTLRLAKLSEEEIIVTSRVLRGGDAEFRGSSAVRIVRVLDGQEVGIVTEKNPRDTWGVSVIPSEWTSAASSTRILVSCQREVAVWEVLDRDDCDPSSCGRKICKFPQTPRVVRVIATTPEWPNFAVLGAMGEASSSGPNTGVFAYDLEKNTRLGRFAEGHNNWVYGVDISPEHGAIVSSSSDHTSKVYDRRLLRSVRSIDLGRYAYARCQFVAADLHRVYVGVCDKPNMKVWDLRKSKERAGITAEFAVGSKCIPLVLGRVSRDVFVVLSGDLHLFREDGKLPDGSPHESSNEFTFRPSTKYNKSEYAMCTVGSEFDLLRCELDASEMKDLQARLEFVLEINLRDREALLLQGILLAARDRLYCPSCFVS